MSERHKRMRHVGFFIFFGLTFLMLAMYYEHPTLSQLNLGVQKHIYDYAEGAYFLFFSRMTHLGSTSLYTILCILLIVAFLATKHYLGMAFVPLNLIGSALLNTWLKNIYLKPRPSVDHLVQASSYSFPSGHAMNGLVFYGLLSFLLNELIENIWAKGVTWLLSSTLILFIGLSRVYLGVHYPIDILGGYLAGSAWLALVLFIYSLLKEKFSLSL